MCEDGAGSEEASMCTARVCDGICSAAMFAVLVCFSRWYVPVDGVGAARFAETGAAGADLGVRL